MKVWIVKRHGSNAANQSMTPVMVLGTVKATDSAAAKAAAAEKWSCYNNQFFQVLDLAGRTRREDREAASDADAAAAAVGNSDGYAADIRMAAIESAEEDRERANIRRRAEAAGVDVDGFLSLEDCDIFLQEMGK